MMKQVYPSKLTIIVNEGNIIPLATNGFNSMTPDIRKIRCKGANEVLEDN
jgi:hypothetical protein